MKPKIAIGIRAEPSRHAYRHLGNYGHYRPMPDADASLIQARLLGEKARIIGDRGVMIACVIGAALVGVLMHSGVV